MLTLAGLINAFGITVFLMPVNLYDSGISGTSMLLGYVTPEYLSLSIFLLVLNLPLFLYGLKRQGLAFTIYASYAVACYSLFSWLITYVLPIDVATSSPLAGDDKLLCAVFGGLISGVGSGLAVRFGGAMDGIEVLAVIFSKRLGMTVGTFVMIYNVILYIVCGFVFASWELPLYSIIAYYAALKTLDFIVEGISRSKAAFIVTVRPEEVGRALSEGFGCGITEIPAKGGYSGTDRTLIYFVVNRFQIGKMRSIVHDVDPSAYITINEVADIFSANHDNEKEKETSAAC
ncbi:MAG: YitT family protein [Oscillospiraceae bacterium]|nr:YitT family protein [Oscillospiraceae bacterium]